MENDEGFDFILSDDVASLADSCSSPFSASLETPASIPTMLKTTDENQTF